MAYKQKNPKIYFKRTHLYAVEYWDKNGVLWRKIIEAQNKQSANNIIKRKYKKIDISLIEEI